MIGFQKRRRAAWTLAAPALVLVLILTTAPGSTHHSLAQTGTDSPSLADSQPGTVALHPPQILYDKSTGRALDVPARGAQIPLAPAAQSQAERDAVQKLAELDPTGLTFHRGLTIHPQPGIAPPVREQFRRTLPGILGQDSYVLIQFSYPFPSVARRRLEAIGVSFYDYVDVGGLIARIRPGTLALLEQMVDEGSVRYIGPIPVEAKLAPDLAAQIADEPATLRAVVVRTFDEPTSTQMGQLGGLLQIDRRSDGPLHIIEAHGPGPALQIVAQLDYVRSVEPRIEATPGNFEGRMAIGADVLKMNGLDGSGVNVMIVDTGIAMTGTTYHPDLAASRILDQKDYQMGDNIAEDGNGHGTHVAGTVGGRYNSTSPYSQPSWQGIAPGASFLIYKLCCGAGQFSNSWFQQALVRGTSDGRSTHISNNSWGGGNGLYTAASEIADRAVRGEYGGQFINMVTIAHNQNLAVAAPGTGKNVITVGAVKDGNYPYLPVDYCGGASAYDWPPAERVCYCNYGPLDADGDGETRVKPDVMAPGAMTMSAMPWYLGDHRYYGLKEGTSMAAPHVSGALALILSAYSGSPSLNAWPELVKALVLASAVNIAGDAQANYYGRGLLDPFHAIYDQSGISEMHSWGSVITGTNHIRDFTFSVPDDYEEVRIVLTWADPPDTMAGSDTVVNDLDIFWVTDGVGTFSGRSDSYDDTVEFVRVPIGYASGEWTVRVLGISVAAPPQSFGLAVHVIRASAFLSPTHSAPVEVRPNQSFFLGQHVINTGYTAGGSFLALEVPTGFDVLGAQVYTNESQSSPRFHWYDASDIYHLPSTRQWKVAIGEVIAEYPRLVRWLIRPSIGLPLGEYSFTGRAHWLYAGSPRSSLAAITPIKVSGAPLLPSTYLPWVLVDH